MVEPRLPCPQVFGPGYSPPVMRRSRWGATLMFLSYCTPIAVAAQPSTIEITWRGPPECGAPERLEQATRQLLEDEAAQTHTRIQAHAARLEDGRYQIDLHLSGTASGTRRLLAESCDELIQASAIVVAWAINPTAFQLDSAPPKMEEDVATHSKSKEGQVHPPPKKAPASSTPLNQAASDAVFRAAIHTRASWGVTPFPSLGASLSLGAQWNWLLVQLSGHLEPTFSKELPKNASARFSSRGIEARACGRLSVAPAVAGRLCPVLGITQISGQGEGLEEPESQTAWLLVPGAQLDLEFLLFPHVALIATGGLQIPSSRPRFVVDLEEGREPVHQITVGGVVQAGFEFYWGRH